MRPSLIKRRRRRRDRYADAPPQCSSFLRELRAYLQEELAYPVVDMKDGTAVGPQKEVGDKAIGDMTKTAPKPEAPAKAPAPAPKPVPSDQ